MRCEVLLQMGFTKQFLDDQLTTGDLGQTDHYSEPKREQARKAHGD